MKLILSQQRATLSKGKFVPVCGYCGLPIHTGYDLHEAIVTRGNIRGNKSLRRFVMVRENSALVHHGDCHKMAVTEEGQEKVIRHILYYEGLEKVTKWLQELMPLMKTDLWAEKTRLVYEVHNGLQGLW